MNDRKLRYGSGLADLDDLDLFSNGQPHEVFRRLREAAPVYWNPESGLKSMPVTFTAER